jgi:hypothetical protein
MGSVQRAAFTILATAAPITIATTKGALIVPDQPSMYLLPHRSELVKAV